MANTQDMAANFTPPEKEATVYKGMDLRLAHQLPGKPVAGVGASM